MTIRARRIQVSTMVVNGFAKDAKKRDLERKGKEYADWLQEQLAKLYGNENSVFGKLEKNTREYNEQKKRMGLDPRRGHATNDTQDALDNATLTEVTVRGKRGKYRVVIVIKRQKLYDEVPYIRHYEELKVPNDTITAFKAGWARNARRFFKGLE